MSRGAWGNSQGAAGWEVQRRAMGAEPADASEGHATDVSPSFSPVITRPFAGFTHSSGIHPGQRDGRGKELRKHNQLLRKELLRSATPEATGRRLGSDG
jgi:hypothetical protein